MSRMSNEEKKRIEEIIMKLERKMPIYPCDKRLIRKAFKLAKTVFGKDKIFHDHIKSHFEKEHPDWEVVCKICGKSYEEIVNGKGI
ncbi:MAG: hypothetical protein DRN81_01985 [Thermoproteota archaeon]|nr:MAG: hypothetical protein DRN81_01985 [Candidatus Korarchaeota archaeon]